MKFTVNRTELLAVAQNAERIAPRVSTIEILQCAYLQAEQDTLTVASGNLEIALEQQIPAQIENEGSVVVKAPLLSGMLRLLDGERVTFQMKNGKLVVSSGSAEYAIPVMDAAQYPRMEIPCPAATVPVSGIPSLTKRTAFAVSEDTARPMLKCVNLIFGADGLQAVSTDSFRIASAKGDRESRGNISFLIPAASLEKLAALVDNREKLQVGTTGKTIVFTKENFSFAARIMEGPYLAVSQVLSNLKQQFTVLTDSALLRDAISQALSVTGTQNRFSLSFAGNRLTVRCESEYGVSETAMDVVALSGEPAGVYWYSPTQLLECLKALNGTLTEGPLKGDIASYFANDALFVCLGGVNAHKGLRETLLSLGVTEVMEAMDMDQFTNPQVRQAITTLRREVQSIPGIRYYQCTWNPRFKGVDDYLLDWTKRRTA